MLMNDVLLRFGDYVTNVLSEELLDGHGNGVHHVLSEVVLD
jgi:hypothetical protein